MTRKLEGKIAVVTGGSAGIGLATAKCFVAEGASVFITGRGQSELDKAVAELGPSAAAIKGNAADLKDALGQNGKMPPQLREVYGERASMPLRP